MFFTNLALSIASPTITKTIVTALPTQWLAFQSLVGCISGSFFGIMWNKENFRTFSIPLFMKLEIGEMIFGIVLAITMCFYFNAWIFAIGSMVFTSIISVWLGRILIAFRSILWVGEKREQYDNNGLLNANISCLIGFLIAAIIPIPLKVALVLWALYCLYNIGWIILYQRNKKLLKDT